MQWPIIPIKNSTFLFPLIFLSKPICVYALGRIKWILDNIGPWNQHFNLKNQRNWKKQVWMLNFLIGIICILLHWWKKLTLENHTFSYLLYIFLHDIDSEMPFERTETQINHNFQFLKVKKMSTVLSHNISYLAI